MSDAKGLKKLFEDTKLEMQKLKPWQKTNKVPLAAMQTSTSAKPPCCLCNPTPDALDNNDLCAECVRQNCTCDRMPIPPCYFCEGGWRTLIDDDILMKSKPIKKESKCQHNFQYSDYSKKYWCKLCGEHKDA